MSRVIVERDSMPGYVEASGGSADSRTGGFRPLVEARRFPRSQSQDGVSPRSARDIAFVPPRDACEARKRIADLDYDIAHIDQQFAVRDARGGGDPNWRHRAGRARMLKDLERSRLRIWLEEARSDESWDLLKAIVETVKQDYEPDEWREVLMDARKRLVKGGG